ncbi:MAG: hypothetical protein Q8K78_04505 [Planctomycetaceae bacterium]|nr:hypothetical protein [Planctomycetaceae bacterium]
MTTIVITGDGAGGTTHIHSQSSSFSPLATYGQATVVLRFTGGTMSPRKAELTVTHPGAAPIQFKELIRYDTNGNPYQVTNAWTNETNSGAEPNVHECEFEHDDDPAYTYQARVVLRVSTSDINYSNPVSGT